MVIEAYHWGQLFCPQVQCSLLPHCFSDLSFLYIWNRQLRRGCVSCPSYFVALPVKAISNLPSSWRWDPTSTCLRQITLAKIHTLYEPPLRFMQRGSTSLSTAQIPTSSLQECLRVSVMSSALFQTGAGCLHAYKLPWMTVFLIVKKLQPPEYQGPFRLPAETED